MSSKTKLRDTIALMRRRLAGNEQGATAIEYALIAAGIGAAVAATVYSIGTATKGLYSSLAAML